MGKGRIRRLYKTARVRDFEHETDRAVRAQQIYRTIDRQPFQWLVVLVAGIGFFLDGYTLFASNIALPMLAYVYWPDEVSSIRLTHINLATLTGTMFGQLFFGIMADKLGRKKMYGFELLLLICASLGVVMSSEGADNSMNVFGWLITFRVLVGLGVGGDYPLSAVITAEFSPTKHRPRMMATVFAMQPIGQIAGNLVSLIVVAAYQGQGDEHLRRTVDTMWKWVIGLGMIPGVIALAFRFAIPETPRFLLDIEDDPVKAEFDASPLFGDIGRDDSMSAGTGTFVEIEDGSGPSGMPTSPGRSFSLEEIVLPAPAVPDGISSGTNTSSESTWAISTQAPPITLNSPWTLSKKDIKQYFWVEGNWKTLFATSMTWLLLDFAFYGIGLSSPQFLAKTYGTINLPNGRAPPWQTNIDPNVSIYDQLMDTSLQALIILNIGSFIGQCLMIIFANRINRTTLQFVGFIVLAAVFVVLGVIFITLHRSGGWLIIAMYIIAQTAFNFGPNSTTYIISGEAFPTRYRASCHGISAAAGKLGSILVQLFSAYYHFGSTQTDDTSTRRYGTIIIVFAAVMLVGAAITWFWIPDMQHPRMKGSGLRAVGKNKTLEELASGKWGNNSQSVIRARRQQI